MIKSLLSYAGIPNAYQDVIGIGWSKIVSIEPVGDQQTLDIELFGEKHGYIAEGIFTHNTAQDIIKIGMIRVYEERDRLVANSPPETSKLWARFKFLLQVHDECMWQCPKPIVEEAKAMIKDKMEGAAKLRCPLVFAVKSGTDWESCH